MSELALNGEGNGLTLPKKLWEHKDPKSTPLWYFLESINQKYGKSFGTYDELHHWSIENIADFWGEVWQATGIVGTPYTKVVDQSAPMFPRPNFFYSSKLNFAQNLLFPACNPSPSSPALIAATESSRAVLTWTQLRSSVASFQASLLALGLQPGERVAGYVGNHAYAVIAMLAATSLGGVWTAVSTDTGVHATLERLVQIEPRVLVVDDGAAYNGKIHETSGKVKEIVAGLPSVETVAVLPIGEAMEKQDVSGFVVESGKQQKAFLSLADFLGRGKKGHELQFPLFEPEQPVYILYSSGTTGAPKCIVHGSAGTLIQHKKEHALNCSIKPGSVFFYFTTTTWMMWHWLVSGLASGATLVLYDGSPFRYKSATDSSGSTLDDLAMARLIEELGITHFGTSAKYLSVLEQKQLLLRDVVDLHTLTAIYSTGSPLAPSTFFYIYRAFGPDINLGSITGGTDIVSLFGAPSPIDPVYEGEIQKPGLGMAIRAFDHTGKDITDTGEAGDLVCVQPFPCQPVMFWGATGAAKYQSSYFEKFTDSAGTPVWHHGDFVRFNPHTRGITMLGRSDGILKPAGVRFGSAEIYNVLLKWFPDEVSDALCIGQRRETDVDETVVLFLKMAENKVLTEDLAVRIRVTVRRELSARHVPGVVEECPEIPVTSNGKKVEGAVKQILCGLNVKTSASVANAECLDWYREWARTH